MRTRRADDDFHVAAKRDNEFHQLFDRKSVEPVVGQRGDLGLGHTKQPGCVDLLEALLLDDPVERQREAGLGLAFACVGQTGISLPEGVAMVTANPARMAPGCR